MATQLLARGTLVLLAFFATITWLAEKKEPFWMEGGKKNEFIEQIAGKANELQNQYGILPSISMSQAILESNWGTSGLAVQNQNYYGIKGGSSEKEKQFRTKEYLERSEE